MRPSSADIDIKYKIYSAFDFHEHTLKVVKINTMLELRHSKESLAPWMPHNYRDLSSREDAIVVAKVWQNKAKLNTIPLNYTEKVESFYKTFYIRFRASKTKLPCSLNYTNVKGFLKKFTIIEDLRQQLAPKSDRRPL